MQHIAKRFRIHNQRTCVHIFLLTCSAVLCSMLHILWLPISTADQIYRQWRCPATNNKNYPMLVCFDKLACLIIFSRKKMQEENCEIRWFVQFVEMNFMIPCEFSFLFSFFSFAVHQLSKFQHLTIKFTKITNFFVV